MGSRLSQIPLRRIALIGALVICSIGCCFYTALTAPLGVDYPGPTCHVCDYSGAPIQALAAGHVSRFFATQPSMGSFTLVLRAPAVAIARSFGAGQLVQYRVGCLICLLLCAGLAWLLVATTRPRGRQWVLVALCLGLLLSGPLTRRTLAFGHPEELVCALLCVAAVVLAGRRKVVLAGLMLGLAVGTEHWALLAVAPVVIACPRDRRRLIASGAGVAAVLILPMLIGDPSRFLFLSLKSVVRQSNPPGTFGVTPTNIWFPYARVAGVVLHIGGNMPFYRLSPVLNGVTHATVIVLGLGVSLAYWLRARRRAVEDVLLVLALIFLLRCVLDPLTMSYQLLPFLAAIISYETLRRRGLPVISIYSAGAIWALSHLVAPHTDAATLNRVYLAWALPVAAYLAYRLFAKARGEPAPSAVPPGVAVEPS